MACEHKHLRCTNNIFYCLNCGAVVPNPYEAGKPEEAPKKKRKTKKEAAADGAGAD